MSQKQTRVQVVIPVRIAVVVTRAPVIPVLFIRALVILVHAAPIEAGTGAVIPVSIVEDIILIVITNTIATHVIGATEAPTAVVADCLLQKIALIITCYLKKYSRVRNA